MQLEDLTPGASVEGFVPGEPVVIQTVTWRGANAVEVIYREADGHIEAETVHRSDEHQHHLARGGRGWAFDGDGDRFRLAVEAHRIRLAHLFDPMLAVHLSKVEPLPHQIDAVYGRMLPRQGLRFALCDDPGAGKTIMAGLYIRELMLRGELQRCLVIAPGGLVTQWQEELEDKFDLHFDVVTRDAVEASYRGNPFLDRNLLIARLDHLARNEVLVERACAEPWDLVVVDEAHRMSAHQMGLEVRKTKRYRVGEAVGAATRNLLLMTATPHAGKEEDFQLWLALLDSDRFFGRHRDGVHTVDTGEFMRRMVKEKLFRFDGTRLFPERRASTLRFELSAPERGLYEAVTEYVREEMNRADRLSREGDRRGNVVGFALTVLQRRLASSPQAIWRSLDRRRTKLEMKLADARAAGDSGMGASAAMDRVERLLADPDDPSAVPDVDELGTELEEVEDEVVVNASTARTIAELQTELLSLGRLTELARRVRDSGEDCKWNQLAALFDGTALRRPEGGHRKLIVFSEHRDTLTYLVERISTLLGSPAAVVAIHGGHSREERRRTQERFTNDEDCSVLVATDAAGEGLNLQQAHLMVNYDLPWNPNRLEQRFGRIHRIGQEEVCHLWNLVAEDTREGHVYLRLLDKLEEQRRALDDQVFDVLGEAFRGRPLRELLMEAVRYGDRPGKQAELDRVIDERVGEGLAELIEEHALDAVVIGTNELQQLRHVMDEAAAQRLQPHHVRSFFLTAFEGLGGRAVEREPGRFQVQRVPSQLRADDRRSGQAAPLLGSYERVCFAREQRGERGQALAALVCPGHPLLDTVVAATIERNAGVLKQGTVLVADDDPATQEATLVAYEHSIVSAVKDGRGERTTVSRRFEFVAVAADGSTEPAGPAPYLDLRPATAAELDLLADVIARQGDRDLVEERALEAVMDTSIPAHLAQVRGQVLPRLAKTSDEVDRRLSHERDWWDGQAVDLQRQADAGRQPRVNAEMARRRAEEMETRRKRRLAELEREARLSSQPPVFVAAALVVPAGLLALLGSVDLDAAPGPSRATHERAVSAVLDVERSLGRTAERATGTHRGFTLTSRQPDGHLRFLTVKAAGAGQTELNFSRSEMLTGLNLGDRAVLALVEMSPHSSASDTVRYLPDPFRGAVAPAFEAAGMTVPWAEHWSRAGTPS